MYFGSLSCVATAASCLLSMAPALAEDAKKAQQVQKAVERGLTFLERDALKWRKERGCATCHHGTMTVWALSEAKAQGYAVGAEAFDEIVQWTREKMVPRIPTTRDTRPGWRLVGVPAIYLSVMSQNVPVLSRDELNKFALHFARHQEADGSFESPPALNGAPPIWESSETLALWALLAWEQPALADPKEAAEIRANREKTIAWLNKAQPTNTAQSLTLRLLLDVRTGKPAQELQAGVDRLLKLQHTDGGWSQMKDLASDAFATGQALYALSFAGVKNDRPEIQRAVSFLVTTQRDDGSWPMTPRNHPGVETKKNPVRWVVPITYFGSCWATLGLVRSVPSPPDTPAKQQHAFDNILAFHGKHEVDEKDPKRPVIGVDLRYYEVSDKEVGDFARWLQAFPRMTTLQFKSTKITDAGLAHLNALPQLRTLALENTMVTDAGLVQLKGLTSLESLSLKGTKVTDAGVKELRKALPQVKIER